jgi:GT2 family glycosyltransferase
VSFPTPVSTACSISRPEVRGKFIFSGAEKIYVRGVTYGTFRPDDQGNEFHDRESVAHDFAEMVDHGINAVRTYTVPPRWFLDLAAGYGLRVMIGLPWQQHVTFLDDPQQTESILNTVRAGVRACAGHPAVLCFAIGNEIPATMVRWYGARRIERFLKELYCVGKAEDPEALFTYVNYPSTEYLNLSFLDFICFNVYLERKEKLEDYLARLQNIAGEKPLLMAEIGLDSQRHGEDRQAEVLAWQVRTAFASGCIGAFVFSWTDEWFRGGFDIEDWDFGLVTREREPKAALSSVARVFNEVPFPRERNWPRISVVVCSYNGARTIRDCLVGLRDLDYPNYEVIVVNDGSKDRTAAITEEFGFQLISTGNRGLSSARNTGAEAASGEIVAYIDDDAYPDPQWLSYLADTFMTSEHAAVGGPNIAPPGGGFISECVAHSPGGPVQVLVSDREAEHIPGCNMAFRKSALMKIGGFDPQFRSAGDDVDVCWRLQDRGWTIGFNPSAMVWHHRRNSVRMYWKQQQGYGKAEALLEAKWPERYNAAGHLTWAGRLYGNGLTRMLGFKRSRIYHGTWGSALFQSIYEPAPGTFWSLPLMPEWFLLTFVLASMTVLGFSWRPLFVCGPLFVFTAGALCVQAARSAAHASFSKDSNSWQKFAKYWLTALLHLAQPLARLIGRLRHGLTLWRKRGELGFVFPWPRSFTIWSEEWQPAENWLESLEEGFRSEGSIVRRGGDFDRWDLEVRGGLFGCARMLMAIEEHGAGKQLVRFRAWPKFSPSAVAAEFVFTLLALAAALEQSLIAWTSLSLIVVTLAVRLFQEAAAAEGAIVSTILNRVRNKAYLRRLETSNVTEP